MTTPPPKRPRRRIAWCMPVPFLALFAIMLAIAPDEPLVLIVAGAFGLMAACIAGITCFIMRPPKAAIMVGAPPPPASGENGGVPGDLPPPVPVKYCERCGTELEEPVRLCPNCGATTGIGA